MTTAYVLMTAMPPTKGHLDLIRFAASYAGRVTVVLNTQPDEPYPFERAASVEAAMTRLGCDLSEGRDRLIHTHRTIEQDPAVDGFWDMWRDIMAEAGCAPRPGLDRPVIIASEPYGRRLADVCGVRFVPYDVDRSIRPIKATPIRQDPYGHFDQMIPEFQRHLRLRVTIFGAESTGKTTLARSLAASLDADVATAWLFEWARPYLEQTVNEITTASMTDIWLGQAALQRQADHLDGTAVVVQDTDLFSTVGYWRFPHWRPTLGVEPPALLNDAMALRSDLYILTTSDIPFEADPLRYGGDGREGTDEYWEQVLVRHGLPYVLVGGADPDVRLAQAVGHVTRLIAARAETLRYDRRDL